MDFKTYTKTTTVMVFFTNALKLVRNEAQIEFGNGFLASECKQITKAFNIRPHHITAYYTIKIHLLHRILHY